MDATSETAYTSAVAVASQSRLQIDNIEMHCRLPDHMNLPIHVLAVEDDNFQQQVLDALFERWYAPRALA